MTPLFPCYLRQVREKWALTQEELAELLGLKDRGHISNLENCRCRPTARMLVALEVIFGVRAYTLFPEFYDVTEEPIVRNLFEVQQRLDDGPDTPENRKKRQLLAEALSRAVLRPKQRREYDL